MLIFDRTPKTDDNTVVLIDASKFGEEYKEGNNQKRRLRVEEVSKIVDTFRGKKVVEDFSVVKTYKDIQEKNYSLSAGQYFDIKIEYVDITEEEFNERISETKETLKNLFKESADLGNEILKSLDGLEFHGEVR